MDARFRYSGIPSDPPSNVFKNLRKFIQVQEARDDVGDINTLLRLDSPVSPIPFLTAPKGTKRKWSSVGGPMAPQEASSLCLRLGHHSSSSSDSKASSATACTAISSAKETDEESSMDVDLDFSLHLGNDKMLNIQKKPVTEPEVDLQLSLGRGTSTESDITIVHFSPNTTAPKKIGTGLFLNQVVREIRPAHTVQDLSTSIKTAPISSATCTSGIINQARSSSSNNSSIKTCQFGGCGKGARGASGLCIAHGGGRRCQKEGCHKGAEGRTVYCKAHGGGRRCEFLGCTKSAEGRTDFCIAHGGGRRCSHEGCTRAARGKSGLCIRHGGGKRCQKENCTKSAEGLSGLCISHGGGRRCQYPECKKGAQGSTMFCKAHGGGKRCTYEGCTKGAEGSTPFCKGHGGGKRCSFGGGGICPKSVHGGTLFCVAHGGGKRCAMPECTKSARGRTDYCVRHGGGKRCKYEGCGKSAQGSTDFCKAHGGGKRCSWGQPGSEFGQGAEDKPCNSFSRGKTGLCASHGALLQDKRVHGAATLGALVHEPKDKVAEKMNNGVVSVEDMNVDLMYWKQYAAKQFHLPADDVAVSSPPACAPEGRVHGGSIMALLKSNLGGPSEPVKMPHNWI